MPSLSQVREGHFAPLFVVGFASFFTAHMLIFTPVGDIEAAQLTSIRVGENTAFFLTFLIASCYAFKTGLRQVSGSFSLAALLLLGASTAVSFLSAAFNIQVEFPIKILCHAINGISSAIVFLYWASLAMRTDEDTFKYCIFSGILIGTFAMTFCFFFPFDMVYQVCTLAFLLICAAAIRLLDSSRPEERAAAPKGSLMHPLLGAARLVAVPAVFTGIVGLACQVVWTTARIDSVAFLYQSVGHAFGISLLVLLSCAPVRRPLDLSRLYKLIAPASLLCVVIFLLVDGQARLPLTSITSGGFGMCSAMLFPLCAIAGKRHHVTIVGLYGIAAFVYNALSTAGYILGAVSFAQDTMAAYGFAFVIIVVLIGALMIFNSQMAPDSKAKPNDNEEGTLTPARIDDRPLSREEVTHVIAYEYGLTAREEEVLGLLLLGRDAPAIANELCISTNTVKSHVKKIYMKTDLHSRQELASAMERYERHFSWTL